MVNSSLPRQNDRHFADDILKCIFMNEYFRILIPISLKIVPKGPIDNNAALVRMMACRRTGNKPLSVPMLTQFPNALGWVGLWGFLWWAPSANGKDHHGVSSGWSSVWHRSNTGLSSTQYEQIPIILGVWPFWLTPFFLRSITFWRAYG